jgi:membrane protein required for colicin V production
MSAADWIIIAVLLISVIHAASSGFFQEIFAIAGLVFGYLLAAWQYHRVAEHFAPYLKSMWLGDIVGYVAIFFGVMVLAGIAGRISRWIMKEVGLSVFDRILGGALGLLRGGLTVAIILLGMTAFTPTSQWLEGSALAPYFVVVGRAAVWVAPLELRMKFHEGLDLLHQERSLFVNALSENS